MTSAPSARIGVTLRTRHRKDLRDFPCYERLETDVHRSER
jgi:hypothetical protein